MRGSRHSLSRPTSCKSTGTSGHSVSHDVHRSMVSDSDNNIISIITVITIIILIAICNLLFAHLSGVYLTTGSL